MKTTVCRLWPLEEGAADHVQATIFISNGMANNAVQAAQDLTARGFSIQVLSVPSMKLLDGNSIGQAAARSNRLVSVAKSKTDPLASFLSKWLSKTKTAIPLVRVGKHGYSAQHIAEACLRNLE